MNRLKDRLYDQIVRKNRLVKREYERYVMGHIKEHNTGRLKHWLVLLGLKWKYRKSRAGTPLKIWLLKMKGSRAKIRMERIPGAVYYNLYYSEDGLTYRFLARSKKHVWLTEKLLPDRLYFFKYKVSMDGVHYNDYSAVLTVFTAENQELFWMRKISGNAPQDQAQTGQRGRKKSGKINGKTEAALELRAEEVRPGSVSLSWRAPLEAVRYNIYRAEESGEYRFLKTTGRTDWTDESAEGKRTYFYKVKYTCDGTRYRDFPAPLEVKTPAGPFFIRNCGRLYEKGAESQAENRPLPIHFAKGLLPFSVISFDVFDTLLLRPFSSPSDVFILVGERLDIMDFCEIRKKAEEDARRENALLRGNREVTLSDIYRFVAEETGIDPQKGAETELLTELSLCRANPYMLEVFRLLREKGKTLVALSDMYLPKEEMERLLASCGYRGFSDILVSCDYNCSKRNGGLYELLLGRYGDPGGIVHVGDNRVSDMEEAQKKGIAVRWYKSVHEAGEEFRAKNMSHLAGSAYRGIVNEKLHNGIARYSPYYEVGYVYTGLYVMGFCQWLYRRAKEEGITKILFLAREGDLYKKVFDQMHPDMDTEYVLWSRIPVVKTIVKKNRHPYLLQLVHHKANALYKSRVGTLFERIGIAPLKEYLSRYRIRPEEYLTPENENAVRKLLIDHWDLVCACYEADQAAVKAYLTRKIGAAGRAAVVDVGWSGNNVLQVKYLAEQVYQMDCRISCFLAAARNVNDTYMAAMMQKREVEVYLFSNLYNKGLHDEHQAGNRKLNSFFFEILTQSCTPTFLGFDGEGGFLYDIPEVENYEHNREIHRGTLDFVRDYTERFRDFPYMMDISGHDAYMPFQYFANNLSWISKYFGGYLFGRDLFATQEKAVMESVSQVMKKAGIWEEGS